MLATSIEKTLAFLVPQVDEQRTVPGMFFQNGLTGEAWGDWSLYTDSPLRALTPAQESIAGTGGPFPENFWDPAGITKGKSDWERTFITHVVVQLYLAELPKVISWMAF